MNNEGGAHLDGDGVNYVSDVRAMFDPKTYFRYKASNPMFPITGVCKSLIRDALDGKLNEKPPQ